MCPRALAKKESSSIIFRMKQIVLLCLLGSLLGCASQKKQITTNPNATLYERLGGYDGIYAVVKDTTLNVSKDERINGFFIGADIEKVNRLLYEQICQVTGGGCEYTGRSMIEVHTGMNITDAQFTALVEDMIAAMNKHGVPQKEQKELLTILGSLHGEIANR